MAMYAGGIEELIAPLKQRMELLEEENRALKAHLAQARQELDALKRGVGITVSVAGRPVATGTPPPTDAPAPAARPYATPADRAPANAALPPGGAFARSNPADAAPFGHIPAAPDAAPDYANRTPGRPASYADYFLD
jgi:antitoxin (DNA-binding transcriptional repressor) of toxin-antitoxin stability system